MSDFDLDEDQDTGDATSPGEEDDTDVSPELNILDDQDTL